MVPSGLESTGKLAGMTRVDEVVTVPELASQRVQTKGQRRIVQRFLAVGEDFFPGWLSPTKT